jgi:hypothetical protein
MGHVIAMDFNFVVESDIGKTQEKQDVLKLNGANSFCSALMVLIYRAKT